MGTRAAESTLAFGSPERRGGPLGDNCDHCAVVMVRRRKMSSIFFNSNLKMYNRCSRIPKWERFSNEQLMKIAQYYLFDVYDETHANEVLNVAKRRGNSNDFNLSIHRKSYFELKKKDYHQITTNC
jgi:hypothetical protein